MKSIKIMIVEDEGITRQWLKKKLDELDMDCSVVGIFPNGSLALQYLKEHEVDVIFTDIKMPLMDGLELLERMQKIQQSQGQMVQPPYKVILSAYDEFHYARRAMKLGAQEFVLKPEITGEGLRQILIEAKKWLHEKQRNHYDIVRMQDGLKDGGTNYLTEEQRELLLRQMIELGEKSTAEGQSDIFGKEDGKIHLSHLIFMDVYFDKKVPRETVMEFLQLFLEQDRRQGVCFQWGTQEFALILNQDQMNRVMEDAENLRELLQSHLGVNVYLGVSVAQKDGRVSSVTDGNALKEIRSVQGKADGKEILSKDAGNGAQAGKCLHDLYRQAAFARANRVFFGIPGSMKYDQMQAAATEAEDYDFRQIMKQIAEDLQNHEYESASARVDHFLMVIKTADHLRQTYIKALCNEMVTAYLQEVWNYVLDEDEKKYTNAIELMLGWAPTNLEELSQMIVKAIHYLDRVLKEKNKQSGYSAAIRQVMRYVEENYGRRVSLEEAAGVVHLNRSYLSALFKRETGINLSAYIQQVRLEKSKRMLLNNQMTIKEIADRTGFFDAAHFSRAFKERYGSSPMEYRRRSN